MNERAEHVGIEIGQCLKKQEPGGPAHADLQGLVERLFASHGRTSLDALACLTVVRTLIAVVLDALPEDEQDAAIPARGLTGDSLRLIGKAIEALEHETGRAAESFTGETPQFN